MRFLCAAVLGFEALVVLLGIAPAIAVAGVEAPVAVAVGVGLAVACVVVAALLRHRWAYAAGTLLQLAVLATAVVLPAMLLAGAVFAGLWGLALVLGARVDRQGPGADEPGPGGEAQRR